MPSSGLCLSTGSVWLLNAGLHASLTGRSVCLSVWSGLVWFVSVSGLIVWSFCISGLCVSQSDLPVCLPVMSVSVSALSVSVSALSVSLSALSVSVSALSLCSLCPVSPYLRSPLITQFRRKRS